MSISHLDLCAGIGAFSEAARLEGGRTTAFAEIEPFPIRVFNARFSGVPNLGDITAIDPRTIPAADLWTAGFPCQDLSVAGKRAGLAGRRSNLFFDIVRLVDSQRPSWIVLENVPGLLSSSGGRDMGTVVGKLADCGYSVAWRVLDAQWFGVPQRRRRVFIVGHTDAERAGAVLFEREGCTGYPAPRGETKQDVAYCLDGGAGGISGKEQQRTIVAEVYDIIGGAQTSKLHAYRTERTGALQSKGNSASGNEAGTIVAERLIDMPASEPSQQQQSCNRGEDARYVSPCIQSRIGKGGFTDPVKDGLVVCPPPDAGGMRDSPGLPRRLDSARYRALGNSAAVPVLRWIIRRIIRQQTAIAARIT